MTRALLLPWILVAMVGFSPACTSTEGETDTDTDTDTDSDTDTDTDADFALASNAFADGATIPAQFTCHGADISPPLAWTGAPDGTVAFAIQLLDPDAGDFLHWTLGGVPASTTELAEGVSPDGTLPAGAWELPNHFGDSHYGGPCPPSLHTYEFTVYALDADVDAPASGVGLADHLASATLDTAVLQGTFGPP